MLYTQQTVYSLSADAACLPLNNSMLFGEGPFTTIKVEKGKCLLMNLHIERLEKSLQYLFQEDFNFFKEDFEEGIKLLTQDKTKDYSLRIHFYKTFNKTLSFYILRRPFLKREEDISLGISEIKRGKGIYPQFLKLSTFSEVFHELKLKKKDGITELLLTNFKGEILECSTSNIFFISNDVFKTPLLTEGVLDGITRRVLIEFLKKEGYTLEEDHYTVLDLNNADEIIICNAVQGILKVSKYNNRNLSFCHFDKILKPFKEFIKNYE